VLLRVLCCGAQNFVYGPTDTLTASASVANIPGQSPALWAHVTMTCVVSTFVWLLLGNSMRRFRKYRWEVASNSPEFSAVLIKSGVKRGATRDDLWTWLQQARVPGLVDVLVVEDKSRYLDALKKWRTAVRKRDRAERLMRLRRYGGLPCCLRMCPGGTCCPSPLQVCYACCQYQGREHDRITTASIEMMQAKHQLVAAMMNSEQGSLPQQQVRTPTRMRFVLCCVCVDRRSTDGWLDWIVVAGLCGLVARWC